MSRVLPPLACLLLVGTLLAADDPPKPRPPLIPVTPGKDTTFITGPLDADGLIDYETALNDRLKGKTTPKTNAVVRLMAAIGPRPEGNELHPDFYKWLEMTAPPEEGAYLLRYADFFGDEIRSEDNQAFFDREGELKTRPWTEKDEPKFAEWLTANEKPLKVVAEAAGRPDYFYPMVDRLPNGKRGILMGCLLSAVQRIREVASILSLRAMYHCGQKKYDAAWADVMTMHRLGRLLSKGATLIESLVGIAIDTIARGSALRFLEVAKPTAKQALAYRDELAKLPPFVPMADKVDLLERFTFLDCAQHIRRNGFHFLRGLLDEVPDVAPEAAEATLRRLDWDRVQKIGNRGYDRLVAAHRKPTRAERRKEMTALLTEMKEKKKTDFDSIDRDSNDADKRNAASDRMGDLLAGHLYPATLKIAEATDRAATHFDTELLAFALAAHFADHGKYPAKLADLVPQYAKAIPGDVYSGKDLIYKPTAGARAGYEVYSVGLNETDDGGRMLQDEPVGDDYGVRMPFSRKEWPKPEDAGAGKWPFPPGGAGKK